MEKPLDVNELLFRLLENEISDEDFARLKEWLCSDPEAVAYYYQFIHDYSYMSLSAGPEMNTDSSAGPDDSFNKQLWTMLAEHEKTAPAKAIKNETETPCVPVQDKFVLPQSPRRTNKTSLIVAVVGIAALALLIVYLHFNPYPAGQEVATLADSIGAEVSDSFPTAKGARLSTYRGSVDLKKGMLKIRYDSGVDVIIEGPASFDMVTPTELVLHCGKLFTEVSESGRGFSVSTQNSRVIDLGTQFGVIANSFGDTEVHVFKGQTMLVAGAPKTKKTIVNLIAGNAGKIHDQDAEVKTIQVNPSAFVQEIRSETGFVWRGENTIPLTHLLAGGIFESSTSGVEIDPGNGKPVEHGDFVSGWEKPGQTTYQKIDSPFMDGIFVPQGNQPEVISSTKLTYQFSRTSGSYFFNLSDQKSVYDGLTASKYPLVLTSADRENTSIFLHPNMGITLDLNKVRQKIQPLQIHHFSGACGITPSTKEALNKAHPDGIIPQEEIPSVDFVILVDGKIKQNMAKMTLESGIAKIDVQVGPTDRFLTLVATDGNQSTKYDWFVVADPALEIAVVK